MKRYKYVGKERDEETGLYYYGARYYSAWLARFISVDPLQHKYPYYTPYQYAGNKPITFIDLDGLKEEKPNNGLSETARLYGRYMQGYFSGMTNSAKFYKKLISDPEGTLTATAEALDNGVQALGLMMDGATIQEMQAYDKANGTNTEAYGKVFDQVIKDFVKASINAGNGDYGDVAEFLGKSAWEVTEAILFSKGAGMLSKSKVAAEVASGLDDVGELKTILRESSTKEIINGKIRLGPNTTPQRYQGPWTKSDLGRAERGLGPIDMLPTTNKSGMYRPLEIHHADNMPGAPIHEVPPYHKKSIWHQSINQGVTQKMRSIDSKLHWQMRGQEMGNPPPK